MKQLLSERCTRDIESSEMKKAAGIPRDEITQGNAPILFVPV